LSTHYINLHFTLLYFTDGRTELRWLRCATAVAAVTGKKTKVIQ